MTKADHVLSAILEVQGKLSKEGIEKNRKNDMQGYKFRGIDDIYNTLSSLLVEAKLCILPVLLSRSVTERTTSKGGVVFYVVVDMEFHFTSALDGSTRIVKMAGEAMDSGDKATNKAMSAAYKYACLQTFCIPTEGDNDADASTHEIVAKKPIQGAERSGRVAEPSEPRRVMAEDTEPKKTRLEVRYAFPYGREDLMSKVKVCNFKWDKPNKQWVGYHLIPGMEEWLVVPSEIADQNEAPLDDFKY